MNDGNENADLTKQDYLEICNSVYEDEIVEKVSGQLQEIKKYKDLAKDPAEREARIIMDNLEKRISILKKEAEEKIKYLKRKRRNYSGERERLEKAVEKYSDEEIALINESNKDCTKTLKRNGEKVIKKYSNPVENNILSDTNEVATKLWDVIKDSVSAVDLEKIGKQLEERLSEKQKNKKYSLDAFDLQFYLKQYQHLDDQKPKNVEVNIEQKNLLTESKWQRTKLAVRNRARDFIRFIIEKLVFLHEKLS